MKPYVIIVAGGKGLRMGGDLPKQFIPFNGKPVLMHTLEKFHRWNAAADILIVLPVDHQDYWRMLCAELGCTIPHRIVDGGETRFHSVKNAIDVLRSEIEYFASKGIQDYVNYADHTEKSCIAIHDGVRPFVTEEVIEACFQRADEEGVAIPVIPLIDSIRNIAHDTLSFSIGREDYVAIQTPQVFWSNIIFEAYENAMSAEFGGRSITGGPFADDASVVEDTMGFPLNAVPGIRENIKITTAFDLIVARTLFDLENESR